MYKVHVISLTFKLGEEVYIHGARCKFIKVTKKGFNFLNLYNNRCKFYHHFYDRKWVGKIIPSKVNTFDITMPYGGYAHNAIKKIQEVRG
jgi:hypothetical protein